MIKKKIKLYNPCNTGFNCFHASNYADALFFFKYPR